MIRRIIVPGILEPKKVKRIEMPKSYIINKRIEEKPRTLLVAAGAGGIPPGNPNNLPSSFKKELTPEFIRKISEMTRDMNRLTKKGFDIFNRHFK